jgi:hypothetical protein
MGVPGDADPDEMGTKANGWSSIVPGVRFLVGTDLAADPLVTTSDDGPPAVPDQSRRRNTKSYLVPDPGAAANVTFVSTVSTSRTPCPIAVPAATWQVMPEPVRAVTFRSPGPTTA